jgi:hypothetical protein
VDLTCDMGPEQFPRDAYCMLPRPADCILLLEGGWKAAGRGMKRRASSTSAQGTLHSPSYTTIHEVAFKHSYKDELVSALTIRKADSRVSREARSVTWVSVDVRQNIPCRPRYNHTHPSARKPCRHSIISLASAWLLKRQLRLSSGLLEDGGASISPAWWSGLLAVTWVGVSDTEYQGPVWGCAWGTKWWLINGH